MKQVSITFLKWVTLLVCVDLASSLIHEDLIETTGLMFALFMLIKLLPQFAEKPFLGLVFSLLIIFISGALVTILLKGAICEWYPEMTICLPNYLKALSFGFFAFPSLIIIPWGAMVIRNLFKKLSR